MTSSSPSICKATAPRVSVVIPTYNRSDLLLRAIDSVLRQTYSDYELIVIDDGSTDDTRQRLEPYMERIRYFYQPNRGASAAQNAGISAAQGEWISILASDDVWHPTKLDTQLLALQAVGHECEACFTDCELVGSDVPPRTAYQEGRINSLEPFEVMDDPLRHLVLSFGLYVQSMLVLRSLLLEIGGFDESLGIHEDADMLVRLSFRTKFCLVPSVLVQIDRAPSTSRLSDLNFSKTTDESCGWTSAFYKKVLSYQEIANHPLREAIHEMLIGRYYSWIAERISGCQLRSALVFVAALHAEGPSYNAIMGNLIRRAAKKVRRLAWAPARRSGDLTCSS